MPLFATCVLNFYKIWIKLIHKSHVIWTENQKYRVFTNFDRSYVDRIFRYENIKDNYGEISQETIDIHLNSST